MADRMSKAAPWPISIGPHGTTGRSTRPAGRASAQHGEDKTAFVFSGGAARGAIQVGMLRALMDRGIMPDLIVGTSVGAFNGAWLAALPTAAGVRQLEDIWMDVRQETIFSGGPMSVLVNLVRRQPSLYGGDAIQAFLRRVIAAAGLESTTFECLRVPLVVVATNLTRGRPEVFDRGLLIPALLASAAIPALLPPVTIEDEQYVDGGLLDNVGLRVAVERGATRIYVLDTSWDGCAEQPATSLEGVLTRSVEVVTSFHLQCALERYAEQAALTVLRDDGRVSGSSLDFSATPALMAAGYAIAREGLAEPASATERTVAQRHVATRATHPRAFTEPEQPVHSFWQRVVGACQALPTWLVRRATALDPSPSALADGLPSAALPTPEAQRAAS